MLKVTYAALSIIRPINGGFIVVQPRDPLHDDGYYARYLFAASTIKEALDFIRNHMQP